MLLNFKEATVHQISLASVCKVFEILVDKDYIIVIVHMKVKRLFFFAIKIKSTN